MELQRNVLPFDKEEISESEFVEHANYYYERTQEGLMASDMKTALQAFREVRKHLVIEHKYYDRSHMDEVAANADSHIVNDYYWLIVNAKSKTSRGVYNITLNEKLATIQEYAKDFLRDSKR